MPTSDSSAAPEKHVRNGQRSFALKITGSYRGTTGHDQHTRSIVKALWQNGIQIQLHDLPHWSPAKLPATEQEHRFEELAEPVEALSHLHFCMPHQVCPTPGMRNINFTMFESDRIPKIWSAHSKQHDLIIVPVESSRQAWIAGGVPDERIAVCPLGVDAAMFAPNIVALTLVPTVATAPHRLAFAEAFDHQLLDEFGIRTVRALDQFVSAPASTAPRRLAFANLFDQLEHRRVLDSVGMYEKYEIAAGPARYRVRFLNVADLADRKNHSGLLRTWLLATKSGDDAALLLKVPFHSVRMREFFILLLRQSENYVVKSFKQAAPIFVLDESLAPMAMPALYTAATHYISLSFGEGFDLPMVEAGVSGLQLVAPRHSAYLDYLSDDVAYLLPCRPIPAKLPSDPATQRLFAGSSWWEPDMDTACSTIRCIIDCEGQAKTPARDRLSQLSWSATAATLERLILA